MLRLYFLATLSVSLAERIQYISTEHPAVTYWNPKYLSHANMTSRRFGRDDPFYYVDLHLHFLWPMPNNISLDFVFHEFLSNTYRRSFVEMHFKICDLVHKDKFFGTALKQGMFDQPCPFPPGAYNLYNMSIPVKHIPPHFPFTKGRIVCNLTSTDNKELVASGYIDMEIKEISLKRRKTKKV